MTISTNTIQKIIAEIEKDLNTESLPLIRVFPEDVTEGLCKALNLYHNIWYAVVSINDAPLKETSIPSSANMTGLQKMYFPDIDYCDATHLQKYAAKQNDLCGLKDFVDRTKGITDLYIVHCVAGISRPPAVASAMQEYLEQKDNIWNSGKFIPNRHVYDLALNELQIRKSKEEKEKLYQISQTALR